EALFELHPYVLTEAGLETALRTIGQRAARRGGFRLRLDLHYPRRHQQEQLILAAARELLINAARHASARNVTVRLAESGNELSLAVTDDGRGFDPNELNERLAQGHIGLAAQRLRVESAGGTFDVRSSPGWGTTVEMRLPVDSVSPG
ncbi:MAG TPA: ATP-binding protein, partial [Gaiellaceae bacterium]|nr:ATP-binding protein [Gaiellaceae bacterium]